MLKPRVGEMVSIGSPLIFFRMVVLPALSRPLQVCGGFLVIKMIVAGEKRYSEEPH